MSDLGSLQSGVFHGDGISMHAGSVYLTAENESISVCFDPDQLSYPRVWSVFYDVHQRAAWIHAGCATGR